VTGDTWIINGQKKWIGNSPWCDISIIWARDLADNQVKAFIVENKTTPGFTVAKIQNKIALKVVQNGLITMEKLPHSGGKPPAGRSVVPRYCPRLENDAFFGRLGGGRMRHGRLRKCGQVLPGALQFGNPSDHSRWCKTSWPGCSPNITASQCLLVRMSAA